MQNISKTTKRVLRFWKEKIKEKNLVVCGAEFPDEYVRRFLQKEDLVFPIKKGLYVLKNKGEKGEDLAYQLYWSIAEKILKKYEPWSIEKESALALHIGDESIPQKLLVHTSRKINYSFSLPSNLQIQIRPDPAFHEVTRQNIKVGRTEIFLDVPEKVLLNIRKRKGLNFKAFLRGTKFDRRMLEVLYSKNPKPVIVKELIGIAEKNGKSDLSKILTDILKRYTIYRP